MSNLTKYIIVTVFAVLFFLVGTLIASGALADDVPAVVIEMTNDIREAQIYVRDHEQEVIRAKGKASTYRETICKVMPKYCTKEYLDPLDTGVDLSVFIEMKAKL